MNQIKHDYLTQFPPMRGARERRGSPLGGTRMQLNVLGNEAA